MEGNRRLLRSHRSHRAPVGGRAGSAGPAHARPAPKPRARRRGGAGSLASWGARRCDKRARERRRRRRNIHRLTRASANRSSARRPWVEAGRFGAHRSRRRLVRHMARRHARIHFARRPPFGKASRSGGRETLYCRHGQFRRAHARQPQPRCRRIPRRDSAGSALCGSLGGLAQTYDLLREYTRMPASQAYGLAREAAMHALALDERLASAHAALGFADYFGFWDVVGGERQFQRGAGARPRKRDGPPLVCDFVATAGDGMARL